MIHDCFAPLLGEHWIGAETLRTQIAETGELEKEITFHDFGTDAVLPFEKENLTHLPCLAVGGDVHAPPRGTDHDKHFPGRQQARLMG